LIWEDGVRRFEEKNICSGQKLAADAKTIPPIRQREEENPALWEISLKEEVVRD